MCRSRSRWSANCRLPVDGNTAPGGVTPEDTAGDLGAVNLWPAAPGLRVVIWHQDIDTATSTRLAAVTLPAWLLVVLGGSVGGVLILCLVFLDHPALIVQRR